MAAISTRALLDDVKTVPVLAFSSAEEAVDTCGVLISGGLRVLELTMRHPSALDALRAVKIAYGDKATIGMGTITSKAQLTDVLAAGADFGVSPGLTPALADAVHQADMPFLPGIATVSEAMRARDMGFDTLKFFPAEQSGGPAFLSSVGAVLPMLKFCPTGGVNAGNAQAYLAKPNVMCFGTSALVKRNNEGRIEARDVEAAIQQFQEKGLV